MTEPDDRAHPVRPPRALGSTPRPVATGAASARRIRRPRVGADQVTRARGTRDRCTDLSRARLFGDLVEEIASALGILKGSLYYYIQSKEHLHFTIVARVHVDVQRLLADSLSRTDRPPLERLALYIHSQTEYNARNVTTIAVDHDDLPQLSADRLKEIARERHTMSHQVTDLVTEAQARGDIDATVDRALAALASYCIFATSTGSTAGISRAAVSLPVSSLPWRTPCTAWLAHARSSASRSTEARG